MKISKITFGAKLPESLNCEPSGEYLFIFLKTKAILGINGTEQLCPSGTLLFLKCMTELACRGADSKAPLADSFCFRMTQSEQQYFSDLSIPVNKPLLLPYSGTIPDILKCMKAQSVYPDKYNSDFNSCAVHMLFISISCQLHAAPDADTRCIPHYKSLKKLRKSIYDEPFSRWNINEICETMNISRTYFHRIYFMAFGVTCMQDVIESRLSSAADMLVNTNSSVSHIAELCGYDSDSYFMRQFKKHHGYTPTEYRRLFSEDSAAGK
ncbi:MAG: helix-turn-helix transcriptional regulator [Ruminococcus sp.]|nr:helix-turn-helix transcriptional regulator [Ruminococcus sp.]